MPSIKNNHELMGALKVTAYQVIKDVAKEITDRLRSYIEGNLYMRPRGAFYTRTGEFLESIFTTDVKISGNKLSITFGLDSDKISSRRTNRGFNQHMSLNGDVLYNSKPITYYFLEWMDIGNKTTANSHPVYEWEGIEYWEYIMDYFDKNIDKWIKDGFKSRGFNPPA